MRWVLLGLSDLSIDIDAPRWSGLQFSSTGGPGYKTENLETSVPHLGSQPGADPHLQNYLTYWVSEHWPITDPEHFWVRLKVNEPQWILLCCSPSYKVAPGLPTWPPFPVHYSLIDHLSSNTSFLPLRGWPLCYGFILPHCRQISSMFPGKRPAITHSRPFNLRENMIYLSQ